MNRQIKLSLILLLLGLMPQSLSAFQLLEFHGETVDASTVELRWLLDDVQGLQAFEVERSTDNQHFQQVGTQVLTDGGVEYSLLDQPAQFSNGGRGGQVDMEQVYYYRLYFVLDNNTRMIAQEQAIEVSFQMSTVSVTWGSIKAMFR